MTVEVVKNNLLLWFQKKNRPKTGFQETKFLFSAFGLCPKAVSVWMFIAIVVQVQRQDFQSQVQQMQSKNGEPENRAKEIQQGEALPNDRTAKERVQL